MLTTPQQNTETVNTAPSTPSFSNDYHAYNSPFVYTSSGPLANHAPGPAPQIIRTDSLRLRPAPHWAYPQQWTSQNQASSQLTASSLAVYDRTHPPPYQSPPPHASPPIVVDVDEFSDGEEPEVDLAEEHDGDADDTTVQVRSCIPIAFILILIFSSFTALRTFFKITGNETAYRQSHDCLLPRFSQDQPNRLVSSRPSPGAPYLSQPMTTSRLLRLPLSQLLNGLHTPNDLLLKRSLSNQLPHERFPPNQIPSTQILPWQLP